MKVNNEQFRLIRKASYMLAATSMHNSNILIQIFYKDPEKSINELLFELRAVTHDEVAAYTSDDWINLINSKLVNLNKPEMTNDEINYFLNPVDDIMPELSSPI